VPFGPCPKHGCFQIVSFFGGVGGEEVVHRHSCESEFGRRDVLMGCHAFWPLWDFMIFRYEFSCFSVPTRFHGSIICCLLHYLKFPAFCCTAFL
jgi:hypothetical protein